MFFLNMLRDIASLTSNLREFHFRMVSVRRNNVAQESATNVIWVVFE